MIGEFGLGLRRCCDFWSESEDVDQGKYRADHDRAEDSCGQIGVARLATDDANPDGLIYETWDDQDEHDQQLGHRAGDSHGSDPRRCCPLPSVQLLSCLQRFTRGLADTDPVAEAPAATT